MKPVVLPSGHSSGSSVETRALFRRALWVMPLVVSLWWFALKTPALHVFERLTWVPLILVAPPGISPVTYNPSKGDWTLAVQVNYQSKASPKSPSQSIPSLTFDTDSKVADDLTASWFIVLGLSLAVGSLRERAIRLKVLRALGIQVLLSVFFFGIFAYGSALATAIETAQAKSDFLVIWPLVKYLLTLVAPYASPFAVAIAVFPQWRLPFEPQPAMAGGKNRSPL